jgi:hypothetical protein
MNSRYPMKETMERFAIDDYYESRWNLPKATDEVADRRI